MNILLAVTGSIAAYKAPDICRGLVNKGHSVKVVLSKGALGFLNPEVFKYLGAEATYLPEDDFKYKNVLHIDLSKWLDTFLLVPASANTISDLAHGKCSDLLSSVFLSLEPQRVRLIYPAMNTFMYNNQITQGNLSTLKSLPNTWVIPPDQGMLACGDRGDGKLPDVRGIVEMADTYGKKIDRSVLITAGATLSPLDPVRYVTNPARGGTAYLLAKKYLKEGYRVHVIKGQDVIDSFSYLEKHPSYSSSVVSTTQDLLKEVTNLLSNFDIYISPMAVSDIEFDYVDQKIKKSSMKKAFSYKPAPDVLKYVVENKRPNQFVVGFAAETDLSESVISEKMKRKPVDLLVANLVNSGFNGSDKKGFGTKRGDYKLVTPKGTLFSVNNLGKDQLVKLIFDIIK